VPKAGGGRSSGTFGKDNMTNSRRLISTILSEILDSSGRAATDRFVALRDVDNKVSEFMMVLDTLPPAAQQLKTAVKQDDNFSANSRRIRLETLAHHCKLAQVPQMWQKSANFGSSKPGKPHKHRG